MMGRRRLLLSASVLLALCSALSAPTAAQPFTQPDTVYREWDLSTFAMDPTAPVFYYLDQGSSSIRAHSTEEGGQDLPWAWSFTDQFYSLAVDYRSRVSVLLQGNSSLYVQLLDEQLKPLSVLKLDSLSPKPSGGRTLQLLADYTNQLWLGFFDSALEAYGIDGTTGTQRSYLKLSVAPANYYAWALDASLNLWVQQSDREQQTYSFSSTGSALSTLRLNHSTQWISSMAVTADGVLIFAYYNDEALVAFNAQGQRLPRAGWLGAFQNDFLTDLTFDADGHLVARAISAQSVLTISLDGRDLLQAWRPSIVSFARMDSLQYDELSGDLFVFGSTEEQGGHGVYRTTTADGSLVQQYTNLPTRFSACQVQQVELSNQGNLWHLLLCTRYVDGRSQRYQVLYVIDRSGRVKRELSLDDKTYFTIYYDRFLVDDDRELLYIPYYNTTSKASVLNMYAFNMTLVGSLPTPFSFTSALVVDMQLNTHNRTVYFLTTTANKINCTLYALSLTAPPTPTPLFVITVATHTGQRATYQLAYTREEPRQRRPPHVVLSVHTFNGDGGVYEYDEAQAVVGQYGWVGGLVDQVVVGTDGRLYGFARERRTIVSWRLGGGGGGQQAEQPEGAVDVVA